MPVNIEIKARVGDFSAVRSVAEKLADSPCEMLQQEDVFFVIPQGRLKLRILAPDRGELIYYERPDMEGPKASTYDIARTPDPYTLQRVLASALGVRGIVRKIRWLYLVGQTRIHLDRVVELGDFLELEVVLRADQPQEQGMQIAKDLMNMLGIHEADLVEGAYIDLLEAGNAGT